MVEAAMVLPILILIAFTLILTMVHFYGAHQSQISLHKEMLKHAQTSSAVFRIREENQRYQSKLEGMVNDVLKVEKKVRCYEIRPAKCIMAGEVVGLDGQ